MPSENRKRHATPPTSGIERCFPRFGSAAGARTVRTSRSGLPSLERLAAHYELGVPTTGQELDGGRLAAARDREVETRSAQAKVADLHPVEPRGQDRLDQRETVRLRVRSEAEHRAQEMERHSGGPC